MVAASAASGWGECTTADDPPEAVDVPVTTVPIEVTSTTADYFVLYVRHDVNVGSSVEFPVLVKRGEAGTTTLAENVVALPAERYRVEKYQIAEPADVDGDCTDDIAELGELGKMSPTNSAPAIDFTDGAVAIPDQETFDMLSPSGFFLKFFLLDMDTDQPGIYFSNGHSHPRHSSFLTKTGLADRAGLHACGIVYERTLVAPNGSRGGYYFWCRRQDLRFSLVARAHTLLAASMPLLSDDLSFHMANTALLSLQEDLPLYRESRVNVVFDDDILLDTDFLALNPGEGYGRLQVMEPGDRPHPHDIVIYEALPNELPRVAGIVSTVPQTTLSHVNLRAVQDSIPNAFNRHALSDPEIDGLLGGYVHFEVTEDGWELAPASPQEVDQHYVSSRPLRTQTPPRDLSVRNIKALSELGFGDFTAFGVKAANLAVLRTLGFPEGTVPDGFAIPFYVYHEFMKANGFYDDIDEMLADEDFQTDFDVRDDMLDDLRDDIKDAATPQRIIDALTAMHAKFPEGASLRYRSSTNNEDLPGFNGAGLYDSKTQKPKETEEDGIDKSLKQVFASLWTFRAFSERDYHRVDHKAAAMGVLVHPNYTDELANGVAVSFDPVSNRHGYYVNTQLGEDLVTNPEPHAVPEELLLRGDGLITVLSLSNLVEPGELLMSEAQILQLEEHLEVIHDHFKELYRPEADQPFAMEIEFKITSDDTLAIKQARPWVFGLDWSSVPGPPPKQDPPSGPGPLPGPPGGGPPPSGDEDGDGDLDGDEDDDGDRDGDGGAGGGGGGAPPRATMAVDAECEDYLCRAHTGVPVSFEDTSAGFVRYRTWEFGDGSRSRTPRTVRHSWSAPGFYEVTLWTSNGRDESTASLTFLVERSDSPGTCVADGQTRCLLDSRYSVSVEWWTSGGESGPGRVVRAGTNESGLFWFFNPDNWEALVKVLDGCALNGQVWVFAASTTDLGYSIEVTDTVTGVVRQYVNEPGEPAAAITDGVAFPEGCRRQGA